MPLAPRSFSYNRPRNVIQPLGALERQSPRHPCVNRSARRGEHPGFVDNVPPAVVSKKLAGTGPELGRSGAGAGPERGRSGAGAGPDLGRYLVGNWPDGKGQAIERTPRADCVQPAMSHVL